MTNELREELSKLETAIQMTKPILERQEYNLSDVHAQLRTPLMAGFMSQMMEHHEAMILLIVHDKTGSALALARSVVEGMYRALWIDRVATDAQIRRFIAKDQIDIGIAKIAELIDDAYASQNSFSTLKGNTWDVLNSYTHNGIQQIGRRFTHGVMQTSYTDEQRSTIMKIVTMCSLVLVCAFLEKRDCMKERDEVTEIMSHALQSWLQ